MHLLFFKLGLTLHPNKCVFEGRTRFEILGILVDTTAAKFLLPPRKIVALQSAARKLLSHASSHRRFLRRKDHPCDEESGT